MLFNIDLPDLAQLQLTHVSRISLWCLADDGVPPKSVEIWLDGRPTYALGQTLRPDVAAAYPDLPFAARSGFFGDIIVPPEIPLGGSLNVAILARFGGGEAVNLAELAVSIKADVYAAPVRTRSYRLRDLIALEPRLEVLGVPHFHFGGTLPILRLLEPGTTHPYSQQARDIIADVEATGIFLDFGCGIKAKSDIYPHAVLLDALHFPTVDAVSTCERLPFRSDIFDAVISQAVFEHLPSPAAAAGEILRVLKPGGLVLIDTAFLQPFHADPSHFFNMSSEGLRRIMAGFDIIEEGIQPYQYPSRSLMMQINEALPFVRPGAWRDRFHAWLAELEATGAALDADLGPLGRKCLAAGVYVLARKPL